MNDLLGVHLPGTDRANQVNAGSFAKREYDQDRAPGICPTNCLESLLRRRMHRIGKDRDRPIENLLDFGGRDAVLLALRPIPAIPLKTARNRVYGVY